LIDWMLNLTCALDLLHGRHMARMKCFLSTGSTVRHEDFGRLQ
jgi:hypothetical protein